MNKPKRYMRICTRCESTYITERKRSKVCVSCSRRKYYIKNGEPVMTPYLQQYFLEKQHALNSE